MQGRLFKNIQIIKIITIFTWKYLICLEKRNIGNDGLVGRAGEAVRLTVTAVFSLAHNQQMVWD